MSKLSEIFESIKATLHWGPSVEPFHRAVINAHDEIEARVSALEKRIDDLCPARSKEPPVYIAAPMPVIGTKLSDIANAALNAISSPVPDDAASLAVDEVEATNDGEQNPAEPGIKPVPLPLTAQPEPVSAGPDVAEAPAPDASTLGQGDDHGAV